MTINVKKSSMRFITVAENKRGEKTKRNHLLELLCLPSGIFPFSQEETLTLGGMMDFVPFILT